MVDQEAFHTQWYKKASDAVCGHEKSNQRIVSVQREWNVIQKTGVNDYNATFVNSSFTKHVVTFKSNF